MSGSFFDILYLYLCYNHTISVSNDCVGGINPFGLFCDCVYCFHSYLSLSIGMMIRYFPVSSYICAVSFCICIVHVFVFISLFGLHSLIEMCASGIISGGGMCLVSLFCSTVKLAFTIFL